MRRNFYQGELTEAPYHGVIKHGPQMLFQHCSPVFIRQEFFEGQADMQTGRLIENPFRAADQLKFSSHLQIVG